METEISLERCKAAGLRLTFAAGWIFLAFTLVMSLRHLERIAASGQCCYKCEGVYLRRLERFTGQWDIRVSQDHVYMYQCLAMLYWRYGIGWRLDERSASITSSTPQHTLASTRSRLTHLESPHISRV